MEKTLGGDRLGSGNKQKVKMKGYERSTHNTSYIWRSTMSSGTLVPFMSEIGLAGDIIDIDLDVDMKTHPTIGPLFGSYKIQLDVFVTPIRLYNAALHMNALNIGLNMAQVKLPQVEIRGNSPKASEALDNQQINSSCIFSYLNMRGLGVAKETEEGQAVTVRRRFNASPWLAYWDIFKNYYSNKQETQAYVIHNNLVVVEGEIQKINVNDDAQPPNDINISTDPDAADGLVYLRIDRNPTITIEIVPFEEFDIDRVKISLDGELVPAGDIMAQWEANPATNTIVGTGFLNPQNIQWGQETKVRYYTFNAEIESFTDTKPRLQEFDLENIDTMRKDILQAPQNGVPIIFDQNTIAPYGNALILNAVSGTNYYSAQSGQEGLAVKTYQSDLFNNWVSTEWIDGENGINDITKVQVDEDGAFTIDALNLNNKIYNMLMRIAVGGGTYDDWQESVYDHKGYRKAESPIYLGGLIKELAFQEVVSNSETQEQPLGTLAGRGVMTGKNKGGKVKVKVDEASYITGIISLTPRIDYSQGNKWDVNLRTMDDLHKPALDQIGFQDLITDQMAWWDTTIETYAPNAYIEPTYRTAGKQPAWINYMTNVNQIRGNFADQTQQMFMVMNRRYEAEYTTNEGNGNYTIKDLTTYIDPSKFNHIFAYTRLDAQNFWAQIRIGMKARRKMSAKLMPNL